MNQRAQELIEAYQLEKHPEGGYFAELYTSEEKYEKGGEQRGLTGSIFFLLEEKDISHFHQIDCEELWYFHEGCGLTVHFVDSEGQYRTEKLGNDFSQGEKPMILVKKGEFFAAENLDKEGYTFISCVTSPKFKYEGFRLVPREELRELDLPDRKSVV